MKTIRQQLTRHLLLMIGLLLATGGLTVYFCTRAALIVQFDATLNAKAQAITTLTEEKNQRIEIEFSDEHMRDFDAGGTDFFELWQADGRLVEHSRSLRESHLTLRQDLAAQPVFWNLTLPTGQSGRAMGMKFAPQDSEDKPQPTPTEAFLIVASTRDDLDRTLVILQWVLAGGGLLLLATTALVVPRILKRELRPLQQLAEEAAGINAASLTSRFSTGDLPGELEPITGRLNELLARLEVSFQQERRFSADVSHEFRTPVAELRGLAELAIKLPDARPANFDQEVLAIALQLESILTQLLVLSRDEQSNLAAKPERVLIGALVHEICAKFRDKAVAHELDLDCRASMEALTHTDPALLRSILSNLVDNAVEYAPAKGSVAVELAAAENHFTIRVSNNVQDLVKADLPHLFERFWRKDTARTASGHSGLGLPLARTFAHAIGCKLTVAFAAPKRLVFTLTNARD